MDIKNIDVLIIGAGPAGLAAAKSACEEGAENIVIIERDSSVGGILQQCIHPGFGLSYFKEELTGPEYYSKFYDELDHSKIKIILNSMVLNISKDGEVTAVSSEHGLLNLKPKSVVLAMGCRERTRSNIRIPGTRPAGVYTAGAAQRLVNRQNLMVGKKVIILGSGDIGMIMARRMTLEGANVVAVVELMDFLAGLTRNKVQCLDDFNIPLYLAHTITRIVGKDRVEGVYIAQVDENKRPIKETEKFYECDTLLLSVGLIPENELTNDVELEMSKITKGPVVNQYMQTSQSNIFACGNVVHVNDLVDNVSVESEVAGRNAARYAMGKMVEDAKSVETISGENVRYVCPQNLVIDENSKEESKLFFRVLSPAKNVTLEAISGDKVLFSRKALHVGPGEIEYVKIKAEDLKNIKESVIVNVK
jgi:NADPH-dependent 2,4-dienoyl-CoA reductase/sulfur reductase-like enzyme